MNGRGDSRFLGKSGRLCAWGSTLVSAIAIVASMPSASSAGEMRDRDLGSGGRDIVTVVGKKLVRGDAEFIVNGVNYFPSYFPAILPRSWLGPMEYHTRIIEEELGAIQALKFNVVSIQISDPNLVIDDALCENVNDFLTRAGAHNLLVNVYIGSSGLAGTQGASDVARIPKACHLAGNPNIFAYDVAWEPHFGNEPDRRIMQAKWQNWLVASYGSILAAASALGGNINLPTDDEECSTTKSVKIAAFRRFMDDRLNHSYRDIRAAIRAVDPTHLIGARSGWGGNGSNLACRGGGVDLRMTAKNFDFVSPESYALPSDNSALLVDRGGFTVAYGDVGKPVVWAEYGLSADGSCPACTDDAQARFYSSMWRMIRDSGANGGVAWWFTGVRPQAPADREKSDFGLAYDRLIFPTVIDSTGTRARRGPVGLCVANKQGVAISTLAASGPNDSKCPSGLPFYGGVFRSEIEIATGSGASAIANWSSQRGAEWLKLCAAGDTNRLIIGRDDDFQKSFSCPSGSVESGTFKPADPERAGETVASDASGRAIRSGWVSLCTRDRSASLVILRGAFSDDRVGCPSGYRVAGTFEPKSLPVYRPAVNVTEHALEGRFSTAREYAAWISVDRDAVAGDWKMYDEGTQEYAKASARGAMVGVRTACFGSTSKEEKFCVGNTPFNGACPAKCLDSEWNSVEIRNANGQWEKIQDESVVNVRLHGPLVVRFNAGNIGESRWLDRASAGGSKGFVRFGCNEITGDIGCRLDINRETPWGSDVAGGEFKVADSVDKATHVSFQMLSEGVAWFGERINATIVPR